MFPQQWSVSPRAQRTRHKHEHLKKGAATGKGCENTMENTPSMVTSLFLAAETAPVIETMDGVTYAAMSSPPSTATHQHIARRTRERDTPTARANGQFFDCEITHYRTVLFTRTQVMSARCNALPWSVYELTPTPHLYSHSSLESPSHFLPSLSVPPYAPYARRTALMAGPLGRSIQGLSSIFGPSKLQHFTAATFEDGEPYKSHDPDDPIPNSFKNMKRCARARTRVSLERASTDRTLRHHLMCTGKKSFTAATPDLRMLPSM